MVTIFIVTICLFKIKCIYLVNYKFYSLNRQSNQSELAPKQITGAV